MVGMGEALRDGEAGCGFSTIDKALHPTLVLMASGQIVVAGSGGWAMEWNALTGSCDGSGTARPSLRLAPDTDNRRHRVRPWPPGTTIRPTVRSSLTGRCAVIFFVSG